MGHRARARRDRPRDDPADRLPGPLPRTRRRRATRRRPCWSPTARSRLGLPATSSRTRRCTRRRRCRRRRSRRARSRIRRTSRDARPPSDILPGEQLTALDFAASTTTTVDSQITGTQRALSVSLDAVHGSLSQLKAGDDIDIYIGKNQPTLPGTPIVTLFRPDIKVLAVPTPEGGNLVLRVQYEGRREVRVRRRPHAPLVRAPSGRRREEDTRHDRNPREPEDEADPVEESPCRAAQSKPSSPSSPASTPSRCRSPCRTTPSSTSSRSRRPPTTRSGR